MILMNFLIATANLKKNVNLISSEKRDVCTSVIVTKFIMTALELKGLDIIVISLMKPLINSCRTSTDN